MPVTPVSRTLLASTLGLLSINEALPADLGRRSAPAAPVAVAVPLKTGGFYVGGRQMIGIADDTSFATGGGRTGFETSYEPGRYTGAVLGYSFGPMLGPISPRFELEGSFGTLAVDSHQVTTNGVGQSPGKTDSFGELRTTTGMFNGYLDANLGMITGARPDSMLWRISPFVGAGVGMSQVKFSRQGVSQTGVVMDASDTRMTWQVSAGIGYQVFEGTTFDIGFRHQRTEGLSFTARDGTSSRTDLVNNMVTAGIRRSF